MPAGMHTSVSATQANADAGPRFSGYKGPHMLATAEYQVRVFIEDTDASGVVYHANYLRFMERARTEMMRSLGIEQSATFEHEVAFVVHSAQMRFLRGARLDDLLRIETAVDNVRAASLVFHQVVRLRSGEPACEAQVRVACVHLKTHRARRIPTELMALMGATKQLPSG
ncbi:MAG: tol-pal system-associated acyl-CoA thioesterase [Myxococcales bacterium]|nr:tol-pal system-associated acyl-CoA thioesterase [Myxococcales bacterium]